MSGEQTQNLESDGQPTVKQVLQILVNELSLQRRHRQMALDQNAALIACDRNRFAMLHQQHAILLGELEIQNKLRSAVFGAKRLADIIKYWPVGDRQSAVRIAKEITSLAADIRRTSGQNSKLIGNQLNYIDFMLGILVKTHRKGCMYGPQGMQTTNRGNLLFNSAA
jgi:hypothetical protein